VISWRQLPEDRILLQTITLIASRLCQFTLINMKKSARAQIPNPMAVMSMRTPTKIVPPLTACETSAIPTISPLKWLTDHDHADDSRAERVCRLPRSRASDAQEREHAEQELEEEDEEEDHEVEGAVVPASEDERQVGFHSLRTLISRTT